MYASFFGLRELPFNNTPDPRYFYSTPDHEEALASLIYAISESRGFVLLTGEVGAGKTLVTRLMLRHFNDRIVYAGINHTRLSSTDLLRCICDEYHIECAQDTGADLLRRLQDFLVSHFTDGKPVVLMLDEAQALSRDAFEQVRMIGNVETDDAKLLQIVIVGQPELRQRFEADDMRQLRQRIFRSFHLRALTREQCEGYIRHRLSVGGAQYPERIFDDDAINGIFQYSQGIPRLINTVCDNAMLSAYAADQLAIDGSFLQRVIEQMTSVAQGGPRYASPRLAASDAAPRRRSTEATEVPAPAVPALVGASPGLQHFIEEAAEHITAQAQRIRGELLAELTDAAARLRRDLAAGLSESRITQARTALENSIERSCVVETRLKSEMIETIDSLHSLVTRAQGLHERLRIAATETEERVDQAASRAARIQESVSAITDQLDTVGRRCAPLIGQLRRHADQARATLAEVSGAASDARAVTEATEAARQQVDDAAAGLATQTSRSGQLTATLRQAFNRLEKQAAVIEARTRRTGVNEDAIASTDKSNQPPERVDDVSDVLQANGASIAHTRDLLASAGVGALRKSPRSSRSRLGEHVHALTAMIEAARAMPR